MSKINEFDVDLPDSDDRQDFFTQRDRPSPTRTNALAPLGSSRVVWNEQGLPEIVNTPPRSEEGMKKLTHTLLSAPYEGHIDEETGELVYWEELAGMTQAEAIQRTLIGKALNGSIKSAEMLFDRAYGKPKQQNENVNVNVSYEEFLDNLAAQEANDADQPMAQADGYTDHDEDPNVIAYLESDPLNDLFD